MKEWLEQVFLGFSDAGPVAYLIPVALIVLAAILLTVARTGKTKAWNARTVAYAALSIALSYVLSFVRLFRMPQGGSITPASMLPVMIFSASFGVGPGVAAGLCLGMLQYLQGGEFLNIWQMLFDYPIAFAALGLAGLYKHFRKKEHVYLSVLVVAAAVILLWIANPDNAALYAIMLIVITVIAIPIEENPASGMLFPALLIAAFARAASAIAAGLMWVAAYPVEGQAPFIYSLMYNGAYLLPELLICLVIAYPLGGRLMKLMK